jgi:hypothetical protein
MFADRHAIRRFAYGFVQLSQWLEPDSLRRKGRQSGEDRKEFSVDGSGFQTSPRILHTLVGWVEHSGPILPATGSALLGGEIAILSIDCGRLANRGVRRRSGQCREARRARRRQ